MADGIEAMDMEAEDGYYRYTIEMDEETCEFTYCENPTPAGWGICHIHFQVEMMELDVHYGYYVPEDEYGDNRTPSNEYNSTTSLLQHPTLSSANLHPSNSV